MSQNLLKQTPQKFVEFLKKEGINRFYIVYDHKENKVKVSDQRLNQFQEFLSNEKKDYKSHEAVFFQLSTKYDTLLSAFVHKTNRGQGSGGTRFMQYNDMEHLLRDGLRLSMGMTNKNALAGLWWGGGKGVIGQNPNIDNHSPEVRKFLFSEYGKFMTSIRGCYSTAEDIGTTVEDMAQIFTQTRFITCIPPTLGGSGNPSRPTARGIVAGMEAIFDYNKTTFDNKTIAIQGQGNVGRFLTGYLFQKNVKKLIVWDVNKSSLDQAIKENPGKNLETHLVDKKGDLDMLQTPCDILSPCAIGGILNQDTIPKLKTKIICGAANNQLLDPIKDDQLLTDHRITYLPDFLVNRMGIVNCADEQGGQVKNDPLIEKHIKKDYEYSIHQMAIKLFDEVKNSNYKKNQGQVAVEMAEKLSRVNHPIYGHRGQQIIDSLVEDKWETQKLK